MRLAPTSAVFPYTTLFRSRLDGPRHCVSRPVVGQPPQPWFLPSGCDLPFPLAARSRPRAGTRAEVAGQPPGDRKSTRLNSSHVKISYAVFCLKKKKKKKTY